MILLITSTVFTSVNLSTYLYNEAINGKLQSGPDIMTDVTELADDYVRPEEILGKLGFVHQPWENIKVSRLTFKVGRTEFAIYEATRLTIDEATELAKVEIGRRHGTAQQKVDANDILGGLDIAGFTNHYPAAMGLIAERLSYDHDIQMNGKTLIQYQVYNRDIINLSIEYINEFGKTKVLEEMPVMVIESFLSNSDLDDIYGEEEDEEDIEDPIEEEEYVEPEDEFIPWDNDGEDDGFKVIYDEDGHIIINWEAEEEAAAAYDEEEE